MLAAAAASARGIAAERSGSARLGTLPGARRLPAVAVTAAALCVAGLIAGGLAENDGRSESAASTPSRFASVSSVRYEYWRVGAEEFLREPLQGAGAGGFRVVWRQERRVPNAVTEVHSLPLEMAAELGLPGLLLFLLFAGGIAAAAGRALRQGAPLAPGAYAVCVAWLLHAAIDWDWQVPAVTLPALVLAGGLLAASEQRLPGAAPPDWLPAAEQERRAGPGRRAMSAGTARRVLVTGGAGFVGANLALELAARHGDWEIVAFDNLRAARLRAQPAAAARGRRRLRPRRRARARRPARAGAGRRARRVLRRALRARRDRRPDRLRGPQQPAGRLQLPRARAPRGGAGRVPLDQPRLPVRRARLARLRGRRQPLRAGRRPAAGRAPRPPASPRTSRSTGARTLYGATKLAASC